MSSAYMHSLVQVQMQTVSQHMLNNKHSWRGCVCLCVSASVHACVRQVIKSDYS